MATEPELIADYACETGEGPLWHPGEQQLYWTDIPNGKLFRYDPANAHHEQCYQGEPVGGFTLQADGALLLFKARGAVQIWRDGSLTTLIDEIPDERESRFNDVIADPAGRVFCGTMPTPNRLGRLYRLDPDGTLTLLLEDIGCSNGMGFTLDRRQMYYTDTTRREIYLFDYDQETGVITNQRVFARAPEKDGEGSPDGMTVDTEGHVWSARWGGSCVVRYKADGTEEHRIAIPAKNVTCVTFGGPNYTDMYVTTASGSHKDTDGPGAGALFCIDAGVRGVPEFVSRIGL